MAFSENTQPSGGRNGSAEKDGERRTLRRKSIKVKKTVLCEMAGQNEGEGKNLYFYINDISPGGMKITSDIFLPEDNRLTLKFYLDSPLAVEARVVWARECGKGNYTIGLEFTGDSEDNKKAIQSLLDWAEPYERKRSLKIHATHHFEAALTDSKRQFYAYIIVISPGGMEITCGSTLPEGDLCTLTFTLHNKLAPVTVNSTVIAQREIPPLSDDDFLEKTFKIWLSFQESEPVAEHLEDALQKGYLAME
ncbi:MAG: PilZ domain-containing protein [Candidatus Xenobiia bacterium LiM19]